VKKDGEEVSVIFSDGKQRGPAIPEATAPRFRYCEEAGMHISCEAASIAKAEAARKEMGEEVSEIFNTPTAITGFSWSDIHTRIREVTPGLSHDGARKRFTKLKKAGLIKKNAAGLYTR
jgi:hypothetical protein